MSSILSYLNLHIVPKNSLKAFLLCKQTVSRCNFNYRIGGQTRKIKKKCRKIVTTASFEKTWKAKQEAWSRRQQCRVKFFA